MRNPLENGSDDATEDSLMANANVDVYPEPILKAWEKCHFNLDFPKLDHKQMLTEKNLASLVPNPGRRFSPIVTFLVYNRR